MSGPVDVLGIGLNATDTLLLLDEFPPYAGKVTFQKELMSPGGQVTTAIVTCAKLGLRTKYVGTLGDDLRGRVQKESLEGTGVDTSGIIVREGCPNQSGFILIDTQTGERTVLWQRDESLRLSISDLNADDITSARMLHIDGCDTDAAAWAAGKARENGIPVSLDVDTVYPDFEKVLRNVSHLVASSSWPRKWTGEADQFAALRLLQREYGFQVAAMTLGHHGALALENDCWTYSPAFTIHCVDTTGAGDVFHGAFCYGVVKGKPMDEILEFANASAALNCTGIGARGHVPLLQEVEELLAGTSGQRAQRNASEEIAERLAEANATAIPR